MGISHQNISCNSVGMVPLAPWQPGHILFSRLLLRVQISATMKKQPPAEFSAIAKFVRQDCP